MTENLIYEGTDPLTAALSSGMTSLRVWLLQQEVWAGGALKLCHWCVWYLGQALGHTEWKHKIQNVPDSHYWRYSSLTQQITLCFIYCFSGLWAFCQAVLLLTHVVATKIWSCLQVHHPRCVFMQMMDGGSVKTQTVVRSWFIGLTTCFGRAWPSSGQSFFTINN